MMPNANPPAWLTSERRDRYLHVAQQLDNLLNRARLVSGAERDRFCLEGLRNTAESLARGYPAVAFNYFLTAYVQRDRLWPDGSLDHANWLRFELEGLLHNSRGPHA